MFFIWSVLVVAYLLSSGNLLGIQSPMGVFTMCEKCFSDDIPVSSLHTSEEMEAMDREQEVSALSRRRFLAAAGAVGAMAMVGCSRSAPAAPAMVRHVVTSGETISSIARDYGLSIVEVIDANRLAERQLRPGQTCFCHPTPRRPRLHRSPSQWWPSRPPPPALSPLPWCGASNGAPPSQGTIGN